MLAVADLEDDLRRSVVEVDLSAPDAALRVWRGFLEHAGRPIAFDARPHPDNDIVSFEVERPNDAEDKRLVRFARRVGVETAELEYLGTIVAACYLTVEAGGAWAQLPASVTIDGHGASAPPEEPTTEPDLDGFRQAVEASDALAASISARVSELVVSASRL